MLYGLYLSATGVLTSSYRQDVIANNLANAETVGFKKDLALFAQRRMAASETGNHRDDPRLEKLSGGTWAVPTVVDRSQGELESTGNAMDVAIEGPGFLMVQGKAGQNLTRDGRLMLDRSGNLILADEPGSRILGRDRKPIALDPRFPINIAKDGVITQDGKAAGRVGVFDVPQPQQLSKRGGSLLTYPDMSKAAVTDAANVRSGFLERSNVDAATELVQLMDAQRQLEANANMIRFQDQTLGRLVNDVGKIG